MWIHILCVVIKGSLLMDYQVQYILFSWETSDEQSLNIEKWVEKGSVETSAQGEMIREEIREE